MMKKEIPPWVFVVAIVVVVAIVGWFYQRSNVFSSQAPIEKGYDSSPGAANRRQAQQRARQGAQPGAQPGAQSAPTNGR